MEQPWTRSGSRSRAAAKRRTPVDRHHALQASVGVHQVRTVVSRVARKSSQQTRHRPAGQRPVAREDQHGGIVIGVSFLEHVEPAHRQATGPPPGGCSRTLDTRAGPAAPV